MSPIDIVTRIGRGDLTIDSAEAKAGLELDEVCKLASHESADARAGAAMLLSNVEPSEKVESCFSSLLRDPDPRVVAESLWALEGNLQVAGSNLALIEICMQNQDWKIRLPAMTILHAVAAQKRYPKTVDWSAIVKQTVSDDCEAVRAEAASMMGHCDLPQETAAYILVQFCRDGSADVRREAIGAAKNRMLPFDHVSGILEVGLRDASYDVRIEACGLAASHDKAKIEFAEILQSLAESTDDELKAAAAAALSGN